MAKLRVLWLIDLMPPIGEWRHFLWSVHPVHGVKD